MEQHIANAMNDEIIKKAAPKYGVHFNDIKRLGGFENFIYEFKKDGNEYVLRFVHSTHRTFQQVFAELEFIEYLSSCGARVSTMIHTLDDELLFKIDTENGEYFIVSAFTKAPGTYVNRKEMSDEFIEQFGKAVGQLHKYTKSYQPKHKRGHWFEDDYIDLGKKHVPENKQIVVKKAIDHVAKLRKYETDIDSYGLIHTDLHFGNMYYDGTTLTFFDWDDASYKHFISDIAIIIFYTFGLSSKTNEEIENETITFLIPFLKGYEQENTINRIWFERLNDFLKLRELILYMVVYSAGEEIINSGFGKMYLSKFEDRIINDIPFFNVERVLAKIWNS